MSKIGEIIRIKPNIVAKDTARLFGLVGPFRKFLTQDLLGSKDRIFSEI